jgi:hypothetical protein
MIFESLEKALETRNRYIITDDNDDFLKHYKKWDFFENQNVFQHRRFGKFFLYEEVNTGGRGKVKVNYPKLAIFVNELLIDHALQVDYINYSPRTWEINSEYTVYYDGRTFTRGVYDRESELKSTILWGDDNLLVYGAWNGMPNWKELKIAYQNTWWFHRNIDELRDLKLKSLLR